ncbi:uncharacterized protein LOC123525458 [Mercenaria mercenaria]|uniref:uncharacterized protein LOC123525458 n=1 Tax=Mercenaria mercenaria TaxID=6596 RepID=UPI001E1D8D4C|nr:uncharacterized protein LOC123525458 [Mercenaria mercenaria]
MHDTIWDIKEAIQHEKTAKENIENSTKKWKEIVSEISTGVTNISTSSHEWRTRFECQYHYNRMLMKHIQRMRGEIRMLRNGRQIEPKFGAIENLKTIGDWRKQTRDLNVEKWSMKSLLNMYERQLDTESMAYYQAHEALYNLTNDVRNTFATMIHEQEKKDNNFIVPIKKSPRKLKPIAQVPPIKALPLMDKENHSYSYMHQRHHLAELDRQRTTFSGLLPGTGQAND